MMLQLRRLLRKHSALMLAILIQLVGVPAAIEATEFYETENSSESNETSRRQNEKDFYSTQPPIRKPPHSPKHSVFLQEDLANNHKWTTTSESTSPESFFPNSPQAFRTLPLLI